MLPGLPGIGVVFAIDELGGNYGHAAKRLFMRLLDPRRLGPCVVHEGDTAATLNGSADEYCLAVCGFSVDTAAVRDAFEAADEPGLAPVHRRFIEGPALDHQPLPLWARIDAAGRLVTDDWNRGDHDLCKEAGWGYAPARVPAGLDARLRAELEELRRRA